jgi:hypothetical protein
MSNMDVRINQRWSTALEVPVQGQSLMESGQSLAQSLVHAKMWTLVAPQVRKWSFFFNQTLQGSYWELLEWIGLLRIGPGAIWKIGIFSCGPPTRRLTKCSVVSSSASHNSSAIRELSGTRLPTKCIPRTCGLAYRLVWAKKMSLAAICLVAGSASFGIREN